MNKLKIEYIPIDDIKTYENNAKLHPAEQIEQIKKSIQEFGFNDPIAIDENNVIIEGHGRYIACRELGINEVPIIRLNELDEEHKRAYMLVHNKLTMNSDFDIDKLNLELDEISFDMSEYGFEIPEIEEEKEVVEVEVPEVPEQPKSKLGDIYQLGKHRLMCGDSTDEQQVSNLLGGGTAQLIVTDPPYNVDLGNINKKKLEFAPERYKGANTDSIENDVMEDSEFIEFLSKAFENANEHLDNGRSFYIWHSCTKQYEFETAMKNVGWKLRQQLIWNKNSCTLGMSDYQWKHEPCMYGWKDGAAHYFIDDRRQMSVIEDKIDIANMKKDDMKKLLKELIEPKVSTTIIDEDKPNKADLHPTMKPLKLIARLVKNSSRPEEAVLDMFGGSGSTLMVCEQLNRKCYTMEYEPKYVDAIINRWEQFTGQKAVLLNG